MLYRPNFCCQCGEKIARARWTPLTSRRFCEFCAIEQKQHDLLPRAIIIIAFLFGAAGLIGYMRGDDGPPNAAASRGSDAQIRSLKSGDGKTPILNASNANRLNSAPTAAVPGAANVAPPLSVQREAPPNSSTEPVYYCGAITRRGTPCTRRVRTKGRCWQHLAQPPLPGSRD